MQLRLKTVAALMAASLAVPSRAGAAGPDCARISRSNLVPCALAASLSVQSERQTLSVAEAREVAASQLLPKNPELEVLAARRRAPDGSDGLHWAAKLSQEVEIGGQRGLRRDEAAAGSATAKPRVLAVRRSGAARAWMAYFDVAHAEREREVAERLEGITHQVSETARAASASGLVSPVDADLAAVSWSRAKQGLLAAEREIRAAKVEMASLLGRDPTMGDLSVSADLEPLSQVDGFARALGLRPTDSPEVHALQAERQAFTARARLLQRTRIPNVTLSAFMESDRFEGQLMGGALSIPLPFFSQRLSGEIAEAEALAARARTEAERARREIRARLAQSLSNYDLRRAELQALDAEQALVAERSLDDLANQIRASRIGVRDALVIEQQLIEFLHARLEAQHALCVASVALAQAAGFPLEGKGL